MSRADERLLRHGPVGSHSSDAVRPSVGGTAIGGFQHARHLDGHAQVREIDVVGGHGDTEDLGQPAAAQGRPSGESERYRLGSGGGTLGGTLSGQSAARRQ